MAHPGTEHTTHSLTLSIVLVSRTTLSLWMRHDPVLSWQAVKQLSASRVQKARPVGRRASRPSPSQGTQVRARRQ